VTISAALPLEPARPAIVLGFNHWLHGRSKIAQSTAELSRFNHFQNLWR